MRKMKGMLSLIWFVAGAIFVISPAIVGYLLMMVSGLPTIVYYLAGYMILMAIDFTVCTTMLHLPLQISMILSVVLPFLQAGFAVSLAT